MRCDQFMGLNEWASNLVDESIDAREIGQVETIFGDVIEHFSRSVKVLVAKVDECGAYVGMEGDEYALKRYTFPDGRVYETFVQAESWSSGPCFFLALKDKDGKVVPESLWGDKDIDNA